MTPDEQAMNERIVDVAEWAAVVLIGTNGEAICRGDTDPVMVANTLRELADDVEARHRRVPRLAFAVPAWRTADGRVWRPCGRSHVDPQVLMWRPDDGGDPMPLRLVCHLHGPITPAGGEGR